MSKNVTAGTAKQKTKPKLTERRPFPYAKSPPCGLLENHSSRSPQPLAESATAKTDFTPFVST